MIACESELKLSNHSKLKNKTKNYFICDNELENDRILEFRAAGSDYDCIITSELTNQRGPN